MCVHVFISQNWLRKGRMWPTEGWVASRGRRRSPARAAAAVDLGQPGQSGFAFFATLCYPMCVLFVCCFLIVVVIYIYIYIYTYMYPYILLGSPVSHFPRSRLP